MEVLKQSEKVITDGNNVTNESTESTDNTYINSDFKLSIEEELKKVKKQLELSNSSCNELSAELNRLKQQTESTVTLTESSTASTFESSPSTLINGQISSTNTDNNAPNECSVLESVPPIAEPTAQQQESMPTEQTNSQLNSEIDLLKGFHTFIPNSMFKFCFDLKFSLFCCH